MDSNTPLSARSLLSTLQGSGTNHNNNRKKRSCRDLLRSKAIPSPQVLEVASSTTNNGNQEGSNLTLDVITQAQDVLLKEYVLMPCKKKDESSSSSSSSSALEYMNRLVVVFRFIQLLLLREQPPLMVMMQLQQQQQYQMLPLEQCHKLVSTLLQRTCQGLCALVESSSSSFSGNTNDNNNGGDDDDDDEENEENEEDDDEFDLWTIDASITSDPRPVIGFAISWLLRINHHYANSQLALMAPLWRGICSVLTVASSKCKLPPELVEDSLKALSTYLVQGQDQILLNSNNNNINNKLDSTGSTPTPSPSVSSLQVKLVTFLVLRVTTLLKLVPQDDSPVVHSIWKLLAALRGMASSLQLRGTCSPIHFEIGTKVQKQVSLLALAHTPSWNGLLKTEFSHHHYDNDDNDVDNNDKENDDQSLVRTCQVLGRALLLQWILKDASQSENVSDLTEPILRSCECLVSVALPECYAPIESALFLLNTNHDNATQRTLVGTLLHTSLQVMCNVLTRIIIEQDDTTATNTNNTTQKQTHRLFCRWMDQKHPLARELSVSLISMVLIETQSIALLSLIIKLLFDHRTTSILRNNISTLLIRILLNTTQNDLKSATQQMVETECLALLESTNRTKKRKRSSKAANKMITWAHYNYDDIQAIYNAIQQCQSPSQTMKAILKSFCQKTKGCLDASDSRHIRLESSKRVALQIAYIEALLRHYYGDTVPQEGLAQRVSRDIGVNISDLLLALVHSVEESPSGMLKEGDDNASAECKAVLASSVLRICAQACDTFDADSGALPIGQICRFLTICTNESTLANVTSSSSAIAKYQRMVVFEAVLLLRSLGKALPTSCPDRILKDVQQVFHRLLSSKHWPLESHAVSALTVFGSTVHASHQCILPRCLPKSCMGLFQSRVQGMEWRKDGETKQDEETAIFCLQSHRLLQAFVQPRAIESDSSIFPSTATLQIAKGSYFLQMPTQEGRQALVIFPPGPQSIVDIRHMYALQDCNDLPDIQSLRRFAVSGGGDGTCLLRQYTP